MNQETKYVYENLLFELKENIGILTINRPKVLNALNLDVLKELMNFFTKVIDDPSVRVVILTGAGDKSFVAGADISNMQNFNPVQAKQFAAFGQSVLNLIEICPKPVIAAVNGFALGGGTEISMACDFIYASAKAKFGQPEINLGILPGFGGTQRLPRLVGKAMAKELVLTGDIIDAVEALRIGLVNKVVEPEKLMDEAMATAGKIASKGAQAIKACKECINQGMDIDLHNALILEHQAFAILCATEDQKEGMKAFLEKRKPEFKDK